MCVFLFYINTKVLPQRITSASGGLRGTRGAARDIATRASDYANIILVISTRAITDIMIVIKY